MKETIKKIMKNAANEAVETTKETVVTITAAELGAIAVKMGINSIKKTRKTREIIKDGMQIIGSNMAITLVAGFVAGAVTAIPDAIKDHKKKKEEELLSTITYVDEEGVIHLGVNNNCNE